MKPRPVCHICGSDLPSRQLLRRRRRPCVLCRGLNDTEAAVLTAQTRHDRGLIDLAGLEREVQQALTDPPKRHFVPIRFETR